ncbi:MAG: hypothetical protein IT287_10040, partial [Bdellovibrionaceae bacterium]|nr:hypothetical protein [Pseudobdellovibrionaceae bacterium]
MHNYKSLENEKKAILVLLVVCSVLWIASLREKSVSSLMVDHFKDTIVFYNNEVLNSPIEEFDVILLGGSQMRSYQDNAHLNE